MTSLMSLCGAANCRGQGLAEVGSGGRPGPGFPFEEKGSKPQVPRVRLAFVFRNPGGYTGVKNSPQKPSLDDSSLMNGLPEGKRGRERRCKSQADITACSGQADIREMRNFLGGCRPGAAQMAEGCTPCSGLI